MAVGRIDVGEPSGGRKPFSKGRAIDNGAATLGAGTTAAADVDTTGYTYLTVLWSIGNATTPATASGDCIGTVAFYEDDGVTAWPAGITGITPGLAAEYTPKAQTLTSSVAYAAVRYNIAGVDRVSVMLKNNNVAPLQAAQAIFYLQ